MRQPTHIRRKDTSKKQIRTRLSRPKTFKSEESAKVYAEANGIKDFSLVDISAKVNKHKFRIVTN